MDNTTIKGETVELNGVVMELINYSRLQETISANEMADGPSVNISSPENRGNDDSYTITVLTYLPKAQLSQIENTSGIKLEDNVYLNYNGINPVKILGKDNKYTTVQGREFRFDYRCDIKNVEEYFLCYLQFAYTIKDSQYADVIWVRDENEDPETDRGTVTVPAKQGG